MTYYILFEKQAVDLDGQLTRGLGVDWENAKEVTADTPKEALVTARQMWPDRAIICDPLTAAELAELKNG